jgi:hypothetical protein
MTKKIVPNKLHCKYLSEIQQSGQIWLNKFHIITNDSPKSILYEHKNHQVYICCAKEHYQEQASTSEENTRVYTEPSTTPYDMYNFLAEQKKLGNNNWRIVKAKFL